MKAFFDTSVLVAAMVEDEPRHAASLKALQRHSVEEGYAALHSVGECFATLTGGRLGIQVRAVEAADMINTNVVEPLELVSLSKAEYVEVLRSAQSCGIRGGAIYDGLLLACARKIGAERILTLNERHFAAFAPDLRNIIRLP